MTLEETKKIFLMLLVAYPKFDNFEGEKFDLAQVLWTKLLEDVPYKVVDLAVKKLILESPFPPTIADVRKKISEITAPQGSEMEAAEAWGEVVAAIRKYGSYDPEAALASMSPRTAKVVKMIGFRDICMSETIGVERGQFLKMYDQIASRERQDSLLPERLKLEIQAITAKKDINQALEARKDFKLVEGGSGR